MLNNKNFKYKKTWLITGGAGFIGSNLTEYLLKNNQKVIVIDNLSNGKIENINSIKNKFNKKNLIFIKSDLLNVNFNRKMFNNVRYIVHLAALGSVPRSYDELNYSAKNNINITLKVLESFKKKKIERIIISSSSSVYGELKQKKKNEKLICKPKSPYGVSKYAIEMYSELYSQKYNIPITIIRLFNVFGPYQRVDSFYSAVIPKWIYSIFNNKKLKIFGTKKISRDFTYVDNVIYAIYLIVTKNKILKKFEIFNIACGKSISLGYVIVSLKKILKINKIKEKREKKREGDITYSEASLIKSKKILKYKPITKFSEGIKLTLKWYTKNIK